MSRDVQVRRGPRTWQWQTVPGAGMAPRPMDRERGLPQVATLRGVPDGVGLGDVMRQMDRTAWVPGSEALTELHWEALGLGRVVFADGQGGRVGA